MAGSDGLSGAEGETVAFEFRDAENIGDHHCLELSLPIGVELGFAGNTQAFLAQREGCGPRAWDC